MSSIYQMLPLFTPRPGANIYDFAGDVVRIVHDLRIPKAKLTFNGLLIPVEPEDTATSLTLAYNQKHEERRERS